MLQNFIKTTTLFLFLTSASFSTQMVETTNWKDYQQKGLKIEGAQKLEEGVYSDIFLYTQETFPSRTSYGAQRIGDCTISQGVDEHQHNAFKGLGYISFSKPSLLNENQETCVPKPKNCISFIKSFFIEEHSFDNYDYILTPIVFTKFKINKETNDCLYVFNTINLGESVMLYLKNLKDQQPKTIYAGVFGWSSYIMLDLQDYPDIEKTSARL